MAKGAIPGGQTKEQDRDSQGSDLPCPPTPPGPLARPKVRLVVLPGPRGHGQMWFWLHHSRQDFVSRVTDPSVLRTVLVLKLKVPHSGSHLSPREIGTIGNPTNDSLYLRATSVGTQDVPVQGCHIIISNRNSSLSPGPGKLRKNANLAIPDLGSKKRSLLPSPARPARVLTVHRK